MMLFGGLEKGSEIKVGVKQGQLSLQYDAQTVEA
jgi:hypothetical protein